MNLKATASAADPSSTRVGESYLSVSIVSIESIMSIVGRQSIVKRVVRMEGANRGNAETRAKKRE